MALCLANSLVVRRSFVPYDQLVRYKWWFQSGYMSSTGHCFDIDKATSQSIQVFRKKQDAFARKHRIGRNQLDYLSDLNLIDQFPVECSENDAAGNGALMRLAPVPLFFHANKHNAVKLSGISGSITHGAIEARDACRYFGFLIVSAIEGKSKQQLLDKDFYAENIRAFADEPLCNKIQTIAEGSYKRAKGYAEGIRGTGYIVCALEAALWAFWSDDDSFHKGVLAAINLGDDTDTTAAIYGQLAGTYYGYKNLPNEWVNQIYAKNFILNLCKWIAYEGENWKPLNCIMAASLPSVDENSSTTVDSQPLQLRRSNSLPTVTPPLQTECRAPSSSQFVNTKSRKHKDRVGRLFELILPPNQ
jgi:ADP-ribosyl-[dinitrogen reductase] hydrolase